MPATKTIALNDRRSRNHRAKTLVHILRRIERADDDLALGYSEEVPQRTTPSRGGPQAAVRTRPWTGRARFRRGIRERGQRLAVRAGAARRPCPIGHGRTYVIERELTSRDEPAEECECMTRRDAGVAIIHPDLLARPQEHGDRVAANFENLVVHRQLKHLEGEA